MFTLKSIQTIILSYTTGGEEEDSKILPADSRYSRPKNANNLRQLQKMTSFFPFFGLHFSRILTSRGKLQSLSINGQSSAL